MDDFSLSNSYSLPQEYTKKARLAVDNKFLQCTADDTLGFDDFHLLSVLFPVWKNEDLRKVFDSCGKNLDLANKSIQNIEKNKFLDIETQNISRKVCERLTYARDYSEAVLIVKEFLLGDYQKEADNKLDDIACKIESQIKGVVNENSFLKRAVAKLSEKAKISQEKEKEIIRLRKMLEQERFRTYSLSIQLSQVNC